MMSLKVCLLASTYPRHAGDGSGRFMHSIAEGLVRQGHEVHVLTPYHPDIRPMPGPVRIHPFKYVWPRRWSIMGHAQAMDSDRRLNQAAYALAPLFFVSGLLKLWQLTRKFRFDVIHAHWVIPNGPGGALVARRYGIPFFISLHGSDIFVALNNPVLGRVARACFGQADGVTACSPQLLQGALRLGANPDSTILVRWGANPELFGAANADAARQLREKLEIGQQSAVILSLGRLVGKKGISYLVRAMPGILEKRPQTVLVIAGDGPEREPLSRLAQSLGVGAAVRFAGRVAWQEVPVYHQLSDIFVVPSVEDEAGNLDGLPTTIPEAMAAGRPVVASRVAGIPLVVLDGQTGLLVDQRDTGQLEAAIASLLTDGDRRRAMGRAGRKLVESKLNWDHVAQTFSTMYQRGLKQVQVKPEGAVDV